jgi:hypothetical protein
MAKTARNERAEQVIGFKIWTMLAMPTATAEHEWCQSLGREYGVTFDRLFVLNNMPISRFLEWLVQSGNFETYMQKLVQAFNPAAIARLMCRQQDE